ncbi:MAG: NADH-quinone oxidoreductase subunit NuoN [Betaproteobacteria bacterium]|nr:NADH-quinone oxidoreductase subunit NuoN [Betaproteobacteria bacterium]
MTFVTPNLIPALSEIFVLIMASLILVVDVFLSNRNRYISYALTQLTLLGAAWITISSGSTDVVYTFNGMFVGDVMANMLKMMTYLAVSAMLVYSRSYIQLRNLFTGEFFVLVLFAMLGMMVMISASHFLTLYLGLELLSLSLYSLVALQRDSAQATEAAMKYFVLGALASGLLLYGMSMIYGATGSLEISKVAAAIQHGDGGRTVLAFGLVFIVAGLAFKLGVVPFHMWIPDVYQGAPTAVTLFIGSAPKIAAFAFVMRLLAEGLNGLVHDWQGMLIIMAVLSMAIGNLAAIAQTNIKRMLAYSTISHMGFLLLGILSGTLNGYSSSMFYVLAYVLMSLGSFGMILLLSRKGFEAENLDDFKGLNQRKPWYAFMLLLIMFSMAGVPPTVGFYAKLSVLQAALSAGYLWLVVFAVLMSVIGAFYYLRIIKLMYFDAPLDQAPIESQPDSSMLISLNGMAVLALGILPQPLMALCAYSIQKSLL